MGSNPNEITKFFSVQPPCCHLHYKKYCHPKIVYFWKIYYRTPLCGPAVNGTSYERASEVFSSSLVVLPIIGGGGSTTLK
jgi:hypothetical protein